MQDLRSIPDTPVPTYPDPLYLEDQVPRRRPPIGKWKEGELTSLRTRGKLGVTLGLYKCSALPCGPLFGRIPARRPAGQ